MKAVIVEDELLIAEHLKSILIKNKIEVVLITDSIRVAEKEIINKPDFYLIDIRLNTNKDKEGIILGEKLKTQNIPFIYITANNDINTLKKAINTEPISYISKPFNERDIIAVTELLKIKLATKPTLNIIDATTSKIYLDQILFCKANGSYTDIVTEQKTYIQRINLKDLQAKLDNRFIRVHRSYIVNKDKIENQSAILIYINGYKIPISRSYKSSSYKK